MAFRNGLVCNQMLLDRALLLSHTACRTMTTIRPHLPLARMDRSHLRHRAIQTWKPLDMFRVLSRHHTTPWAKDARKWKPTQVLSSRTLRRIHSPQPRLKTLVGAAATQVSSTDRSKSRIHTPPASICSRHSLSDASPRRRRCALQSLWLASDPVSSPAQEI